MNCAKLRHPIAILSATRTPDTTTGEPVTTWTAATSSTIQAEIVPLSGKFLDQARDLVPTVTHRISIRYHSAAIMGNRISFQGRTFTINSVLNKDERNIEITMLATEEVGGGA